MKYLDEYRDPAKVKSLLNEIESVVTKNWIIMEICGGQTHSFLHNGLDAMLPPQIELVHGPGCPVCVHLLNRSTVPLRSLHARMSSLPPTAIC